MHEVKKTWFYLKRDFTGTKYQILWEYTLFTRQWYDTCRSYIRLKNICTIIFTFTYALFLCWKISHHGWVSKLFFLTCFQMRYWDFSVKSKSILPMVATSEDTIFIFTVYKKELFQNSRLTFSHAKKNNNNNNNKKKKKQQHWNAGYLSAITARTLTFRDQTLDVTYYTDVTLFLHAMPGCHWLCPFFVADLFCFNWLNVMWPHFLGANQYYT